jgi:hypothetical protein
MSRPLTRQNALVTDTSKRNSVACGGDYSDVVAPFLPKRS